MGATLGGLTGSKSHGGGWAGGAGGRRTCCVAPEGQRLQRSMGRGERAVAVEKLTQGTAKGLGMELTVISRPTRGEGLRGDSPVPT